jgi:hypothetical protein
MTSRLAVSDLCHTIGWMIGLLCLATDSTLAEQAPPELKQRILNYAKTVSPEDYAFTRTIRSEQSSGAKTEQKVTIEKFDPTKPTDARWTLISVNGAPPAADALAEFRKDSGKRRVPGYHRLGTYFGTSSTTWIDSRGRNVFHFSSLPKDTVLVFDTDVSENTTADAIVSDANAMPFVEQLHLAVRPMRLKLIMRLEGYESTARYRVGPEGRPLLMEQTSDMTGSGMGKQGRVHTVTTYSEYRSVKR